MQLTTLIQLLWRRSGVASDAFVMLFKEVAQLFWRWSNVVYGGPTVKQHWFNVLCLPEEVIRIEHEINVSDVCLMFFQR